MNTYEVNGAAAAGSQAQKELVQLQRELLAYSLAQRLERLSRRCVPLWNDTGSLNTLLYSWLERIPHCRLIYATDCNGSQVSANLYPDRREDGCAGQDLSARPYFDSRLFEDGFALSEVYISSASGHPCITAVHDIIHNNEFLGRVAADFELRDLPLLQTTLQQDERWTQITGDPSIRAQLYSHRRSESLMDTRIKDVTAIAEELICHRGVFHAKLHFSSSRATLWLLDDPYRYRIHVMEDIIDPSVCLAYPKRDYPGSAVVPDSEVRPVLERIAQLRFLDENLYLRAGSLNIMNGLVGLTFSCDGSHYMNWQDFLYHGDDFWGEAPLSCAVI